MLQQSPARPQSDPGGGPPTRRAVDTLAVLAVVAPFVVAAVAVILGPELVLGGDQALLALDSFDLRHLQQPLGAYSRTGWAHPGPAWLVLLAPSYWLFGSGGTALVAASLLVHSLFAALVVLLAGTGRAWQRPVVAVVVLGYLLAMPSVQFVSVWNPWATLLPTVLLLLLAARACAGSVVALAGGVVVGSYLVQTHIGTAPLVAIVLLVAGVVLVRRLVREPAARPDPGARRWAALLGTATVLLWVPPLWQQLTAPSGRGNLGLLLAYFLDGDPAETGSTGWTGAASAVGQMLGSPVFGWQLQPNPIDTGIRDASVFGLLALQALGAVVVAALGARVPGRRAMWLSAITGVATVASLVAARSISGPLQNYLLAWVTVLPAVLLLAAVWVVLDRWDGRGRATGRAGLAVVTAVAVALSAAVSYSLVRAGDRHLGDQPGAAEAARLALDALPTPDETGPVLLEIRDIDLWTTATSVALDLEQAGYRTTVREQWVYGFGSDRATTGEEAWRVVLAQVRPGVTERPELAGVVATAGGPAAVLVQQVG